MIFLFVIPIILNEMQPNGALTTLIVSAVIAAISMLMVFLFGRFIKGYDDKLKDICNRLDDAFKKMDGIEKTITDNALKRQELIAQLDRKIFDSEVRNKEQLENINTNLAIVKEHILKND